MLNLARALAERGHAVDLVLGAGRGAYLSRIPASVRRVELGAARARFGVVPLTRYLRRVRPAVLLSSLHLNVVALWARRLAAVPTRVIVIEHCNESQRSESWLLPRLRRRFYPWADRIVAVSRGVADDLARATGIARERVEVVANPVVTRELREKARAPLEHGWFEPGEPPVLLAVGRLVEQKDFETLLRALARVRRRRPARLLILGEGSGRARLESLTRELGLEEVVGFPGFVDNPYPYMARASAFVLSSRAEGLPTVLIEALYCGAVPIATDCPSGPREILADGRYGTLVPVGDVEGLARAIERALAGPSAPAAPESWEPFTEERVVERYLDLFGLEPA